jgi:hypothetical protein
MTDREKDRQSGGWNWAETMVKDYHDYRWHQLLDPLCDTFRQWKAGELAHAEVDRAIDEAYKERCVINNLFAQRQDRAIALIHWWDSEWFDAWVAEHRISPSAQSSVLGSKNSTES